MKRRRALRKMLLQAVLVLAAGAVVGVTANTLSPRRVPLFFIHKHALKQIAEKGAAFRWLSVEDAYALSMAGGTVLIDPRCPCDYDLLHAEGAMNVPPAAINRQRAKVLARIPKDFEVVALCGDRICLDGLNSLIGLAGLGYEGLAAVPEGCDKWVEAEYPMEMGEW